MTDPADALHGAYHLPPTVGCPTCDEAFIATAEPFESYFDEGAVLCKKCSQRIDWWTAVVEHIRDMFAFGWVMDLAGAQSTTFQTTLGPGEVKEIDLAAHDIPADAEVLHLNLTGSAAALPTVLHANQVTRDPFPTKFHVLGRPIEGQTGSGPLYCYVTWFSRRPDDTVLHHLVDAARQYSAQRFDAVVVPANIAAEASLAPILADALAGFASKDSTRRFLQDAATYSHQLNVLTPMVAFIVGASPLPDPVRGVLNRLRTLRNDVAHSGRCKTQDRQSAAEHLAAAIFAVRYADRMIDKIEAARRSGRLPAAKADS